MIKSFFLSCASHGGQSQPPVGGQIVTEPINIAELNGVEFSNNTIKKTSGINRYDDGAVSTKMMLGDGYVTFKYPNASSAAGSRYVSLTPYLYGEPRYTYETKGYSLYAAGTSLRAMYFGKEKQFLSKPSNVNSDIFKLSRMSGEVSISVSTDSGNSFTTLFVFSEKYYKPLFASFSLYSTTSQIETIEISGNILPTDFGVTDIKKIANGGKYNGFPVFLNHNGNDYMYYRAGASHTSLGYVARRIYNSNTNTFSAEEFVFNGDSGEGIQFNGIGIINGKIFIPVKIDGLNQKIGYKFSTDGLLGNAWSNFVELPTSLPVNLFFSGILNTDIAGRHIAPFYSFDSALDRWTVGIYIITNNGNTWTKNVIYDEIADKKLDEMSVAKVGLNSFIGLARNENGKLWITKSVDNGDTWTPFVDSGLGGSGINVPKVFVNGLDLIIIFHNRENTSPIPYKMEISISKITDVMSNFSSLSPSRWYSYVPASPNIIGNVGYSNIIKISGSSEFLHAWTNELFGTISEIKYTKEKFIV